MPLKPPGFPPVNQADWDRWTRSTAVVPDDNSVTITKLADKVVTNPKLRDSIPTSVIGRVTNTPGTPADIGATTDDTFFVRRAGALGFGALADTDIPSTIARDSEVTTAITAALAAAFATGTYTPTLTNVTNLDTSGANLCAYTRIGSVVTVSGRVDLDPTAAGAVELGISLPIASNFTDNKQCSGIAFCNTVAGQGAAILSDLTNDRASLQFIAVDTSNRVMMFVFQYQVV